MLLYAVTDRAWLKDQTLYEQVEAALKGGVTCVQLREKELGDEDFLSEALEIGALCKRYNVPFFINDNVEVAIKCKADGIHVGQDDMSAEDVRKLVGNDMMLGVSVHTVEEADRLRGRIVYLNRDDVKLPKGTHFIQDLLGLTVEDADNGHVYGTITDVLKTGANDVYQVSKDGRDYLIPVIPEVVLEKDIDAVIDPGLQRREIAALITMIGHLDHPESSIIATTRRIPSMSRGCLRRSGWS